MKLVIDSHQHYTQWHLYWVLGLRPNPVLSPRSEEAPNDEHLHRTHAKNHCASRERPPEDTLVVAVQRVAMSGLTGTEEALRVDHFVQLHSK